MDKGGRGMKVGVTGRYVRTPLGEGAEENIARILRGESSLRQYADGKFGIGERFTASLFGEGEVVIRDGMTRWESMVCDAVEGLRRESGAEWGERRTVLVVSTTKGNAGMMVDGGVGEEAYMGASVRKVARAVGIDGEAYVVCNACISGVSAMILGKRMIEAGECERAVVVGCDEQSRFIVSGFMSFKALDEGKCRPFDAERKGLNLGEACAAVLMERVGEDYEGWTMDSGYVRNDANHISGPSRTGEGSYRALLRAMEGIEKEEVAFVNAHGTATMYNDEMESIAIARAGMGDVRVNGLKGVYGHTMGAAGVLEVALSMAAVERGVVLPTAGYEEKGVSGDVSINKEASETGGRRRFVKLLSGFGGCNAAGVFSLCERYDKLDEKEGYNGKTTARQRQDNGKTTARQRRDNGGTTDVIRWDNGGTTDVSRAERGEMREKRGENGGGRGEGKEWEVRHRVVIDCGGAIVDGEKLEIADGGDVIGGIYREYVGDYPKFHKMDRLSKLAFVGSELLLRAEGGERFVAREDRAVVFVNRSSSVVADWKHAGTVSGGEFFPSPAVFVYTLPNISTGEVAIRNKYYGETCFYVVEERSEERMESLVRASLLDGMTESILFGWVEYGINDYFCADMSLIQKIERNE